MSRLYNVVLSVWRCLVTPWFCSQPLLSAVCPQGVRRYLHYWWGVLRFLPAGSIRCTDRGEI